MRSTAPRRGIAVLMVLLLLSLTVGLCYAAMRGQSTIAAIQRNATRRLSARQAALTGMAAALKKMHASNWPGVGTSLGGSLGKGESYEATYTAGDPTLAAGDPAQPYRVTVLATGYALDPQNPQSVATHRVRAVVGLIPRRLAAQPADFVAMKGFTVYETKKNDVEIDIPFRVTGPARFQQKLKVARNYPDTDNSRTRYLADLNAMRNNGYSDYRPFGGPVSLPFGVQEIKFYNWLAVSLGVSVVDASAKELTTDWTKPTAAPAYRIYPGGPLYTAQAVAATLQSVVLSPDVATNPLGIFFVNGALTLGDNVTINGSLICTGDVKLSGTNITLCPPALPALAGASEPIRLAALCCNKATVKAGAGGRITGLVAVFDEFLVERGSEDMAFALAGQLAAAKITVRQRTPWDALNWGAYYDAYLNYLYFFPSITSKYFPIWMANFGRSPVPLITIAPESPSVAYHWANSYDPIYRPHADDGGLRWNLLSWAENP